MIIKIYPNAQLKSAWEKDKAKYSRGAIQPPLCNLYINYYCK